MKCPRCDSVMRWNNDFSYDECGYNGEGLVSFYSCQCGVDVEVCIPDENEEEEECLN